MTVQKNLQSFYKGRLRKISFPSFCKLYFGIILYSLFQNIALAQTYRFQDAGINDQLPNIEVTKMLQDRHGYMWFGTRNGLVKYDGINVEVFQFPVLDSTRQDKNRPVVVTALSESAKGDIWVGTANGEIGRFDRVNNRLTPFAIGPENKDLYKPFPLVQKIHENELEENVFTQQTTDSIYSQGQIISLFEDSRGILWSSNHNQSGFFKIVPDTNTYHNLSAEVESVTWYSDTNRTIKIRGRAKHILEDKNGTLWTSGDRGFIELHTEPFAYKLHQLVTDSNHNWFNKFAEHFYLDSIIVAGSASSGINVMNLNTKQVSNFIEPLQEKTNLASIDRSHPHFTIPFNYPGGNIQASPAKCLFFHQKDKKLWTRLWVFNAQKHKYMAFDPNSKQYKQLDILLEDGQNIEDNPYFENMYQDGSGTIWASNEKGIFKATPQSVAFNWLKNEPDNLNSLLGEKVSGIYKIEKNKFWVTTDAGFNLWDIQKNTFERHRFDLKPYFIDGNNWFQSLNTINDLLPKSDNELWLATNLNFQKYNTEKNQFVLKEFELKYFNHTLTCYAIAKDNQGKLWLGYHGRLIYFNPATKKSIDYTFPGHHFLNFLSTPVTSLLIDDENNLWIGTKDKGMFCLDTKQVPKDSEVIPIEAFESFEYEGAQPKIIDSQGNLWATSPASGIIKIDLETRKATQYTEADGLSHDNTFNIVEDNQGKIWIGTYHGLSCFDPTKGTFQNYYQSDGLPTDAITGSKASKTEEGNLLFPTENGVIAFNPKEIRKSTVAPDVVLTSFKVDNQEIPIGKDSPLKKHISLCRSISLRHDQNDLIIAFSALHFNSPEKNQYAVLMENEDETWRKIGNQSSVTYTNLAPGKYTFNVKAANSDEVWTETPTQLTIVISPPLWATWWAYTLYVIGFSGLAFTFYRSQLNKKLNENETKRLVELDKFKSKFYTNITHEFRTPLTIIMGISEELMDHNDQQIKQQAYLLNNNASNLRNLINQLLDLSKIRSKSLDLNLQQSDVFLFLKFTLEPFASEAKSKNLKFEFTHTPEQLFMDFDQEKLRQIIFNLMANAIKFTEKGFIKILAEEKIIDDKRSVRIQIKDTGVGISTSDQLKIFDNFYQVDDTATRRYEGSGIGLALTKELSNLMGGKISVDSKLGEGSTFSIELPITNLYKLVPLTPALIDLPNKTTGLNGSDKTVDNLSAKSSYSVLLIEDNNDLHKYLSLVLREKYKVKIAKNGAIGIEKAIKDIPDIIVCDVMMPEKDGFEVCTTLKKDERTSHIPIIFLTAKTNLLDKIKGLHLGADAYINKPFNKEELLVTIEKCLNMRAELKKRYAKLGPYLPSNNVSTQANDSFLIKLNGIIEENLQIPNLPIPLVANKMSLSRSQLHRKVTAITGKNASKYILFYRLQLAKELLVNTDKNISEIAYEVGFSDPNYFSRKFNKEFGTRPSAIRNIQKK